MNRVFEYATEYNHNVDSWDIDSWDVSKVTTMQNMFHNAQAFNQPLNSWDVSQVTNMTSMFDYANRFNGDITGWDTSEVIDMTSMFKGYGNAWGAKTVMNQDLDGWDVSKVTSMESMFEYAREFNNGDESLASWDVSKVTNMRKIFKDGSHGFSLDLTTWNVSSVGLAGTTEDTSNMREAFRTTVDRVYFDIEANRHNLRCAWEPLVGTDVFRWAATKQDAGQTLENYARWGTGSCTSSPPPPPPPPPSFSSPPPPPPPLPSSFSPPPPPPPCLGEMESCTDDDDCCSSMCDATGECEGDWR